MAEDQQGEPEEVESAFELTVEEGKRRLTRTIPALVGTGLAAGVDVSIGIFAMMLVLHHTDDNLLLGAIAFSFGFIALTLARSELFTENFLVPIAGMLGTEHGVWAIVRLWTGTALLNLAGGWVVAALVISGFPQLRATAIDLGQHFTELGVGWRSFSMAMLAGMIITVMTWMVESTRSRGAQIVASAGAGFLLAAAEINHCIVASLEMFAGLIAGAPYSYRDWLTVFAWAALGNMVGGVGLVTVIRFVQAGSSARIRAAGGRPQPPPREQVESR